MITKTTETGIQALMYMALSGAEMPVSPRLIAEDLGLSATYLAKVTTLLVKGDVLEARRGVKGGVVFRRPPERITLLEIVEALQGKVVGRYCDGKPSTERSVCNFHRAMLEVQEASVAVLGKWTLAELASRPVSPNPALRKTCLMSSLANLRSPRKAGS